MLGRIAKYRDRLGQFLAIGFKPDLPVIRAALQRALQDRLAGEDSSDKKAVVLGKSVSLARLLGLRKTQLLVLPYPDFTVENLALLGDDYDFVIGDRILHRCESLKDAASEITRVLRPGGWFVLTACLLDLDSGAGLDLRRSRPRALEKLFSPAASVAAHGWGNLAGYSLASWIVGQKMCATPDLVPTVTTRESRWRAYRFRPRAAKFGVAAMARNEAPYLLEWIAYYRVLGFGQITIYDNCSNDASAKILGPLARAGIINAIHWKNRRRQQARAYEHAARRLRPLVEWCLFVDLDEFLLLDPGLSLEDLIPKEPDVSAVAICWRVFGSAAKVNREIGPTIERFTMAARQNSCVVKSLVRLAHLSRMTVHVPKLPNGRMMNVEGETVAAIHSNSIPRATGDRARLNHYQTRSWEEFECKRARGFGAEPGQFISRSYFDRIGPGEVELVEILRLVPAVKEEVARLRKIVDMG